jgi:hypothetical protein
MFPNLGRLLGRLGVSLDGVGTHRFSGDFRLDREFSPEVMEIVQVIVEGAYDRFLGEVADCARHAVEEIRRAGGGPDLARRDRARDGPGGSHRHAGRRAGAAADRAGLEDDFEVELIEPEPELRRALMVDLLSGRRLGFSAWPRSLLERLPVEIRTLFTELEPPGSPRR